MKIQILFDMECKTTITILFSYPHPTKKKQEKKKNVLIHVDQKLKQVWPKRFQMSQIYRFLK